MPKDDPNGPAARRNQATRDLKNRVFALESEAKKKDARIHDLEKALNVALNALNLLADPPGPAIEKLCLMPVMVAVGADIAKEVAQLAEWYRNLASGNGAFRKAMLAVAMSDTPADIQEAWKIIKAQASDWSVNQ